MAIQQCSYRCDKCKTWKAILEKDATCQWEREPSIVPSSLCLTWGPRAGWVRKEVCDSLEDCLKSCLMQQGGKAHVHPCLGANNITKETTKLEMYVKVSLHKPMLKPQPEHHVCCWSYFLKHSSRIFQVPPHS